MYEIVSRLRQHNSVVGCTEVTVFFNHDGKGFRLDWNLPDTADLTEEQLDTEIDTRIRAGLRSKPEGLEGGVTEETLEEWRSRGAEDW